LKFWSDATSKQFNLTDPIFSFLREPPSVLRKMDVRVLGSVGFEAAATFFEAIAMHFR